MKLLVNYSLISLIVLSCLYSSALSYDYQNYDYYRNGFIDNNAFIERETTQKPIKFDCTGKQDEGHYEHQDCRKYWHCLYVGTVFQSALERKCPIGTMYHPVQRQCEISISVKINLDFSINKILYFFFLLIFSQIARVGNM